jgi:hypothetical protein
MGLEREVEMEERGGKFGKKKLRWECEEIGEVLVGCGRKKNGRGGGTIGL